MRLEIRGSNFSGKSMVFAIPEIHCFVYILSKKENISSKSSFVIVGKHIIKSEGNKMIPITINLEFGLVGQSRMLYRT